MMMRNDDKSSTCFSCEYFSFYPNKRRREKKFTALSSSRCHWCLLNFISFFKDVSLWHTHTLYRLSTQCGLIQLHDNLVAWKTDHLDCLFPRGFFSICVWKWRVKSLVQNKRKEERPPHPILLSLGVSILACGRANFKKPKRKKKRWWWWSSSSFHTQNPYGGNYRRRVGPQRLLCSGRPSESSSSAAAAAAAPPVSCFCRDRNLIRLALWTTCAIRRRTRRGESTCCEDQERDSIYRPLYYIRGLLD